MKKLFLASFASVTLELIKPLLTKPATETKVVFITTAANTYTDRDFVNFDRDAVAALGFMIVDIDIAVTQNHELEKILSDADVIFVAGGNTFYLLDQARKSGFDSFVQAAIARGVIYVGSSAGTALCCSDITYVKDFDDPTVVPDLTDYTGLNLVSELIIPHAQKEKYFDRITAVKNEMESKGFTVLTLRDDQVLVVTDDAKEVQTLGNNV